MSVVAETGMKEGGDITYKDMVDETDLGDSEIQQMFAGATVLLTGGTGFLGKLLIEKLLRSCPDIRKIYLLARPKKNKDPIKRLQEQFDDVLYSRLHKEQPDFLSKLQVIEGEISQKDLGISDADRQTIINEVDFIFHGAATVRFDESLKYAVAINVRGSREMLALARACTRLRAYVHISTAYSNCTTMHIEEKFYKSSMEGDKLIDLVENMDETIIKNITPGLLGDYPNTYAYTKAAAEDVVLKHSKGLPVALFRPSIVIATANEPIVGWIDNVYGPTGVIVGAAVGLLRVLKCDTNAIADLVPGDMVVNACIALAYKTAKDHPGNHETAPPSDQPPKVYNYVSSEENPLTWERYMRLNMDYGLKVPTVQSVWAIVMFFTTSNWLFKLLCMLLHQLPATIVDGIALVIGKKPMLRKTYQKIEKFAAVIGFFACRSWKFENGNVRALHEQLGEADRQLFPFSIGALDWEHYSYNQVRGIRLYLLKDPMDTVPRGRRKYYMLLALHYFVMTLLLLLALRLLWWIFV